MSQIVQGVSASAFVLLPVHVLPVQQEAVLATVLQTYERALEEVRALSRPAITERLFSVNCN